MLDEADQEETPRATTGELADPRLAAARRLILTFLGISAGYNGAREKKTCGVRLEYPAIAQVFLERGERMAGEKAALLTPPQLAKASRQLLELSRRVAAAPENVPAKKGADSSTRKPAETK